MMRFLTGRRGPRPEIVRPAAMRQGGGAPPGPLPGAGIGSAELAIEELEARLTPNYPGAGTGYGDTGRTVGWGC